MLAAFCSAGGGLVNEDIKRNVFASKPKDTRNENITPDVFLTMLSDFPLGHFG